MVELARSIAEIGSIALIPVGVLLAVQYSRMLRLMEQKHPDLWRSLGAPRFWFSRTVAETTGTLGFLWRREYQLINDSALSSVCSSVRALHFLFATLIFIAITLFCFVAYHELGLAQ